MNWFRDFEDQGRWLSEASRPFAAVETELARLREAYQPGLLEHKLREQVASTQQIASELSNQITLERERASLLEGARASTALAQLARPVLETDLSQKFEALRDLERQTANRLQLAGLTAEPTSQKVEALRELEQQIASALQVARWNAEPMLPQKVEAFRELEQQIAASTLQLARLNVEPILSQKIEALREIEQQSAARAVQQYAELLGTINWWSIADFQRIQNDAYALVKSSAEVLQHSEQRTRQLIESQLQSHGQLLSAWAGGAGRETYRPSPPKSKAPSGEQVVPAAPDRPAAEPLPGREPREESSKSIEIRLLARGFDQLEEMLRGAKLAIQADNPERYAHFCVSIRRLVDFSLEIWAPDIQIESWLASYDPKVNREEPKSLWHEKRPSRRARARFLSAFSPFGQALFDSWHSASGLLGEINKTIHDPGSEPRPEVCDAILVRVENFLEMLLEIGDERDQVQ